MTFSGPATGQDHMPSRSGLGGRSSALRQPAGAGTPGSDGLASGAILARGLAPVGSTCSRRGRPREFDLLCPKGRTFSFAVSPSSRAGGLNLYACDITERKRAEEAVQRSEALLRAVTDNSPDPIFLKDRDSRITSAPRQDPRVLRPLLSSMLSWRCCCRATL